ncbi:MAG: ABC transporter ATP-binding protein [Candidatus Thermoplasmatota archaeon]|nr:ABC transporter ATP-binding protein [Candidatus Thermoplasmatota archaeon]
MNVVEVRGLRRSFGKVRAVDGLDLEVRKGEVFGLLGPNGSGKTTLIRILCGLLKADRGEATVLGESVGSRSYLMRTGYMPQEIALYEDLTVHENLKLFCGIYRVGKDELMEREREVLTMVDLYDRRGFVLSTLSGGQKHRISLAVAMVHSPELLFLDEPTVGVDPPLRAHFWDTFRKLKEEGRTVIMSTHYMDEAMNCDRIGMMRNGKLIALGTPVDIMRRTGSDSLEDAFLKMCGEVDG